MKSCPVCNTTYSSPICPKCKFDASCNYELHPTLQELRILPKSVFARRADLMLCNKDFVIQDKILVKYIGDSTNPIIPSGIIEIGKEAFRGNEYIESVVIPEGVKKIGICAFAECPELTTLQLPKSLETIGAFAFSECPIKRITLPEGLVSFGDEGTFYGTNIQEVVIPGSVKTIPIQCFSDCLYLEKVILMPGVRTIESDAFSGCKHLKTVTIPDTLEAVDANFPIANGYGSSFDGCGALTDIIASDAWKQKHPDILDAISCGAVSPEALYQKGTTFDAIGKYEDAFRYYSIAANREHALATVALGKYYLDGKGVPQNVQKAIKLFEKSYSGGNDAAAALLFSAHNELGSISEKDCQKLIAITKELASKTTPFLKIDIDFISRSMPHDLFGVARSMLKYESTKATGIAWIEKCAANGLDYAQSWLGERYYDGVFLPMDRKKAIYWLEKAAAQGDSYAANKLEILKKRSFGRLFS